MRRRRGIKRKSVKLFKINMKNQLQNLFIVLVTILFSVTFTSINQAATFPDKPSRGHYYIDLADMLDDEAKQYIDTTTQILLKEEGLPIVVATIRSLASQDAATLTIEEYAAQLFNHWGIGTQERNYGALLLISKADRKARIELGAGWKRDYDSQAEQVMQGLIIPSFKRGDFSKGIREGVRGLDAMARGLDLPSVSNQSFSSQLKKIPLPYLIGMGIFGVCVLYSLVKSGRDGWGYGFLKVMGIMIFFLFSILAAIALTGGRGFGGGSSGGGGATGSW